VLFAGAAADVDTVVVGGREIVRDGRHARLDVAAELAEAIGALST
jgi:cytosine/adenosine deaminase-related metal-dependent hydrolase